jgi:hypothetical protein
MFGNLEAGVWSDGPDGTAYANTRCDGDVCTRDFRVGNFMGLNVPSSQQAAMQSSCRKRN